MSCCSFNSRATSPSVGGGGGALSMLVTTSCGASACFKQVISASHKPARERSAYRETEHQSFDALIVEADVLLSVCESGKIERSLLLLHRASGKILHR